MRPKIKDSVAWEQANLLMQPALIRIIDNIRKQLDESVWKGTYQDVQTPYPGYHLCLQNQDRQLTFDVWELCYQVCFNNYHQVHSVEESQEVEIDTSLIDETGDVDWNRLDAKAKQVVQEVFASLPLA